MQPRDTDRLTFRPVTMDDATLLRELNRAPGVMTFLDRNPQPIENLTSKAIPERLRIDKDYPGYGLRLAFLKETGQFVGRFNLKPNSPSAGNTEIGYMLMPEHWGQGLGSEGCLELLRFTFDDLRAERLVAITMFVNTPSRSLMERIGLKYIRTFHEQFDDPIPGTEKGEVEYALTREEWLAFRGA